MQRAARRALSRRRGRGSGPAAPRGAEVAPRAPGRPSPHGGAERHFPDWPGPRAARCALREMVLVVCWLGRTAARSLPSRSRPSSNHFIGAPQHQWRDRSCPVSWPSFDVAVSTFSGHSRSASEVTVSVAEAVAGLASDSVRGARARSCALPWGTPYCNTSSARANTDGGIVRPRALAVLRFTTSSNFVDCSTGRSAGLAPLRILST